MRCAWLGRLSLVILLIAGAWSLFPPGASAAAGWVAPLPEPLTVTRPFDPPADPYAAGHRGVDLAGSPGQEVRAAGAGTVVYAGPLAGRGVVSVEHADGLRTTYEPVLASVTAGLALATGQVIGTLQTAHVGCPIAACLHWGLRRGDVYLDPLLLLSRGPVRLLPRYGARSSEAGLDPAVAMTAGPLAIGVLGLLPFTRRMQRTPAEPARGEASGAAPTAPVTRRVNRFRRADGPGDRPL